MIAAETTGSGRLTEANTGRIAGAGERTRSGVDPNEERMTVMQTQEITTVEISAKIKQIIAQVANLDAAKIADDASLRADLKLDSLSLLEIGVDVDYTFKLGIPDLENQLAGLQTLPEVVGLVERLLAEKAA